MLRTISLVALTCILSSCKTKVFNKLSPDRTGIHFNNIITENDSINILDIEYVYNGGGVAISDFNNDGLQDIFFTGNLVGNKLYLNRGNMRFEDITETAKVSAKDKWNTGVATVDINNDGLLDIYVCASIKNDARKRANTLFINKGLNKEGIPTFADEAQLYNIADTGHSTSAAFFDYDNDGDLDLYVLTNQMAKEQTYPNQYKKKIVDGSSPTTDRLYRNDWDSLLNRPVFKNVSKEAGILIEGYGLGLNICDLNKDGWKDIYVTNDFITNDLLWINNRNGTFTNRAGDYFKHTSYSAMGNDVADINNDGLPDVIAVDMLPGTNERKKMMMSANSYQTYMNNEEYKYEYQYGRNTLQLNQGYIPKQNDSVSHPVFSDIAFFSGVAETDWSWAPMVTDFDHDGFRDIIITNGFPKDITDHDFMTYRANAKSIATKEEILEQIPEVKLHNYAFRNNGDLTFTHVTSEWGLDEPSFSSGAAYGDLDNDGDLDVVINNINDLAFVYENTTQQRSEADHYLQIRFKGDRQNIHGLGAWIEVYYDGNQQVYEHTPYRGYISTVQLLAHFGLGNVAFIDSVVVKWPNRKKQVLQKVATDQVIEVDIKNAKEDYSFVIPDSAGPFFTDVTNEVELHYQHQEIDFPDFNIQRLLPHKLSEYGPALAAGDINQDGLDDIVCGGSYGYSASILFQQKDGMFIEKALIPDADKNNKPSEDMGLLLFDADGDKDLDMYITCGSYESAPNTESYQDKLYINDGKGNYRADTTAIPKNFTSKSCVRAGDFDRDGDLDLFLAGRVEPWHYPKPVSCFIYRNDSRNGNIKFADVTASVAKDLINIGLTCDGLWTDFDNDGWVDLMLAGEWMNITFLKNDKGVFKNISNNTGISAHKGWWNSIAPGDFDNDGDIDYVVGNTGKNTFYQASSEYPLKIYAKDFDNNGSYDAIPSLFIRNKKGQKEEYPAHTRDDLIKQIISMRSKFHTYALYSEATMDKVLTKEDIKGALVLEANNMASVYIKNLGGGQFQLSELPVQAQLSTINGMVVDDFDADGNLDVVMNTNDYGTEVSVGRYDALNGLLLKGDGKGSFSVCSLAQSGIYIPGNGKAMVKLVSAKHGPLLIGSQNRGPLKAYKLNGRFTCRPISKNDFNAMITFKNGKKQKQEFYYGSSFLSQSSRFLLVHQSIKSIETADYSGNKNIATIQ